MKSAGPGINLALDPEAPAIVLQFDILSSKTGQKLKVTEKLIKLQKQALQSQSSSKENAQPNKFNQQGCQQSSGMD